MSGIALEWAISQNLSGIEKVVLCALASFHSQKNPHPYPSRELLANVAGVTVKTVSRIIPKLEERKLIRVRHSSGRHSNRYELQIEQGHRVPVNKDTESPLTPPNKDFESPEQGPSVHPTGTQSPTNKDMNKDMNKKEGANAPTIWDLGEGIFGNRAYVTKLIKEYGEKSVVEVIAKLSAMKNPPNDPRGYVQGMLKNSNEPDDFMVGVK